MSPYSLYIDCSHSSTVEKMYLHKHKRIQVAKPSKTLSVPHVWHFHHLWTNLKKHQSSIQVLGWHFALCNQSLGHIEPASVLMLAVNDLDRNWYPAKPHQTYRSFPIWQEAAALWISFSMSQRVTPLLTFSNGMYRNRVRWLDRLRMSSP